MVLWFQELTAFSLIPVAKEETSFLGIHGWLTGRGAKMETLKKGTVLPKWMSLKGIMERWLRGKKGEQRNHSLEAIKHFQKIFFFHCWWLVAWCLATNVVSSLGPEGNAQAQFPTFFQCLEKARKSINAQKAQLLNLGPTTVRLITSLSCNKSISEERWAAVAIYTFVSEKNPFQQEASSK